MTIAGDGSTIVNIYYTRNTYSIKFYKSEWKGGWFGRYEWPELTELRITAKYGADIADKWPSATSKIWGTKKDKNGQGASPYQSGIATMPLDGGAFYYVRQNGEYTMNLNYYVEGLDGKYTLDHTDSFKSDSNRWSTTKEDHYDIPGFTYTNNVKDGAGFEKVTYDTYKIDFKYSRNTYNINFINGDNKRSESYKYGADISGVDLKTTPKRPSGVPESYTFAGWYDNELGAGDPVKLSGTMPAKNITLYAKWAAPEVNGKAYLTVNGGDSVDLQLEYGDKIDSSQLPSVYDSQGHLVQTGSSKKIVIPAGYDWKGWATKDGDSFTLFNFNTEIYGDIELYPFYVSNGKYKVEYSAGAGTGSVEDPKLYAEGSHADVQYASAIKAPAGKVFLYWQSENGSHYYPDDKIAVNSTNAGDDKVITLTAVYGSKAAATKLTYKSNYPDKAIDENGSGISAQTYDQKYNGSTDLNNNTRLKTLTIGQTGFTLPLEYQFTGWNTKADGSGKAIAAKASADQMADILVDNKGDNILYAQWTKKPVTEITVKPEDKSKTYDGTALKADSYKITGGSLGEGDKIVATYSGSQTDAGSSDSSFATFKIMHNDKVDVTSKLYKVTLQKGKLEVTKRKVTLTTGSDEKTYDGTPLTKAGVTVSGDEFVDGEVSDIKATGSRTDAGTSKNTLSYNKLSGFKDGNYEIKEILGDLTVKKANTLMVSATGYKGIYDGNSHSASAIPSVSKGTTVYYQTDGGQWTTKVPSIKDVGEKTVSVKAENPNYETATAETTLKVTRKPVTVTANDASKVFGEKDPELTASVKGTINGDTVKYQLSREKGEEVGTYAITPAGENTQGNYILKYEPGKLEITKSDSLNVTAKGYTGTYDGTSHRASAVAKVGDNPAPDGTTIYYKTGDGNWTTEAPSIKNAGEKTFQVKAVNSNYEDAVDEGVLKVEKRKVTLTSETASKTFDGTPLTRPDVTVSGDGFAPGEGAEYNFTGTQTEKGESENTFTYKLHENTLEGNYNIEVKYGKLVVDDPILYTATIHYRDAAGNTLAPDFAGKYMAGDSFTITSPAVPGYTPQQTYVTMDSMPERDVEVTVVYTANAVPGPGPGPGPSPIPTVVPGIAPGPIAAAPGGAAIVSVPAGDGLTQLKDVKTAKGLKELHEKCNILPFLFMLLTMIVVIAYSKAMKKDQEEIFQLKEELESRRRF